MTTNLVAVTLLHNVNAIRYPWKQAFYSALPIVDKYIFVVAGPHSDDTLEDVFALGNENPDKVVIVYGPTNKVLIRCDATRYYLPNVKWPDNHNGLSALVNDGMNFASDKFNPDLWCFQLQADEVLDENDYGEFCKLPTLGLEFNAASFRFRHYCGDFHHVFPFEYGTVDFENDKHPARVVRACRFDSNWVNVGDAVQMQGSGKVYDSSIVVHHCGKIHVGRAYAAAKKEFDFQTQLYVGHAFSEADPRVVKAYRNGGINYFDIGSDVKEFAGPWPKYVREYAKELGVEL